MTDLERCDQEIADAVRLLLEGHLDIEGLRMALTDWRTERKLILEALRNNVIESEE